MPHDEMNVAAKFNEAASHYDEQRRKLIPCFDDFYSVSVSLLNLKTDAPEILDIGAGTGLLSNFILRKYPKAKLTLIDISEQMLHEARSRFKGNEDVIYITSDYTEYRFEKKYDAVVSSLSIHHLEDEDKQKLYRKIHQVLLPGGLFINADQVQGNTPFIDKLYREFWEQKVEASGLSRKDIEAAYERTKLDKMAPLAEQLSWLRNAGFSNVDCVYKYFNFVVLFGQKSFDAVNILA